MAHFTIVDSKVEGALVTSQVCVVASLPCYSAKNVDQQRGQGVFEKSIQGLLELNALGYGVDGSGLSLDLVYNPGAGFLPPAQATLQEAYKAELKDCFGIVFNRLFTITNMPIKRFADFLYQRNELASYMQLLVDNFNPAAVRGLMCRELVSVRWDGQLYDCDFNQQLDMRIPGGTQNISQVGALAELTGTKVFTDSHCFGCTAGAGSSCSGTTA
jgi:radical SAM/Cys-rich protein